MSGPAHCRTGSRRPDLRSFRRRHVTPGCDRARTALRSRRGREGWPSSDGAPITEATVLQEETQ